MSVRLLASFVLCLGACSGKEEALPRPPAEEATSGQRWIKIDPEIERRLVGVAGSGPAARPRPRVAQAPDPVPVIGKTYRVEIGDRAVIVNRKPISDGYRRFRRGSDCRIEPEGSMTVLGTRAAGDPPDTWTEYLVRYARPPETSEYYVRPRDDSRPFACPSGAKFYHEDPLFISEDTP